MKTEEMIVEMVNILTGLSVDTYVKCKYIIMSSSRSSDSKLLFAKIFEVTDRRRPKLLEMKGGAVV